MGCCYLISAPSAGKKTRSRASARERALRRAQLYLSFSGGSGHRHWSRWQFVIIWIICQTRQIHADASQNLKDMGKQGNRTLTSCSLFVLDKLTCLWST
ncbi:hypothetical protein GN956_G15096 [Arapaima gigas]